MDMHDSAWRARLSTLGRLAPGWLDGSGLAMKPGVLEHIERILLAIEHLQLPMPAVFPRPDGCIQLEWRESQDEVIVRDPTDTIEVTTADGAISQIRIPWSAGDGVAHPVIRTVLAGLKR